MNSSILIVTITSLTLFFSQLQAQLIILDEVMSKEEQKKTGVSNLKMQQKMALEAWLNQNFVRKAKETSTPTELSLSINIDNGQKIQLSDNSLWEISPDDVSTAAVWITPFPIKISPSGDADYPCLLINTNTGVSVKARELPAISTP